MGRLLGPLAAARRTLARGEGAAPGRVHAGDGGRSEERSRWPGPAGRAGAWIRELRHWPHRRERPARWAIVVVDRHGTLDARDGGGRGGGTAEGMAAPPESVGPA